MKLRQEHQANGLKLLKSNSTDDANVINRLKLLKTILFIALSILILVISIPLPKPMFPDEYSTILVDQKGDLLAGSIADDGQWRFPPADSIPDIYKQCVLTYEDEYFYYHPGINPISILKAFYTNMKAGEIKRGGSTITMQVSRMARGNKARTVWEKSIEILLALKLEIFYSKKDILNLYSNNAPFGGNVIGLSAASWRYFGRSPKQLSWGESATMAVLPNDPAAIFPGRNNLHLLDKRNNLLNKLFSHGIIDSLTLILSKAEPLPGKPKPLPVYAPHLLTRALNDGLKGKVVQSTIDLELQKKVTEKTRIHASNLRANHINNAAALVIDIETGITLAYVGNIESVSTNNDKVDIITAKRSTGSLLKPFLYSLAIDRGIILPKELLPDIPAFFQGFAPQNFDKKFNGVIHADKALTYSLNVPFVYLLQDYGYEQFHCDLQNMGLVNSLNHEPGHYGLSIILGGVESSLWELTSLYAGFYRSMNRTNKIFSEDQDNPYFSNRYLKSSNPELFAGTEIGRDAIWFTLKTLQELTRPDELSGWQHFESGKLISWKTGTSYGLKDGWAIGLNSKYVVGVWTGNADGEGRPGLTGIRTAAPLMFDIFSLLDGSGNFEQPADLMQTGLICTKSGQKAGAFCDDTRQAFLPKERHSANICQFHQIVHLDEDGEFRVNSGCYPVTSMKHKNWFVLPPVEAWYYKSWTSDYKNLPEIYPGCKEFFLANEYMEPIYPKHRSRIYVPIELDGSPGKAIFEVAHQNKNASLYWHMDEQYLGKTTNNHQMDLHPLKGNHRLKIVDDKGLELEIIFEVISG
jgi:penicillin-binding protein 1C